MGTSKMKLPEITLDWLREKNACVDGYNYCAEVKITDPIALINRLIDDEYHSWANWLIVKIMDRKQRIAYATYAAEIVLPIFEKKYPDDLRPRKAIEAAKKCLECDSDENRLLAYYADADAYFARDEVEADCVSYYAVRSANHAANYAYCASDYSYLAAEDANRASKCKAETYKKILAYGIELLTKEN